MIKKKSDKYASEKAMKLIFFIVTIIILIFCLYKSKNMSKIVVPNNNKENKELLFTSKRTLTKFSTNKVEVVKVSKEIIQKDEELNISEENSEIIEEPIIYDNMTEEQLTNKLNRTLTSSLSGTGYIFSSFTAQTGMDPYLAVAIVLHETGCKWGCSDLVDRCYNVGGIKGSPGCYNSAYQAYSSLEEGINSYLNKLYYNYYANGLTTPELINPVYAESGTWAQQVNNYIYEIKNA